MPRQSLQIKRTCLACNSSFMARNSVVKAGYGKFCSHKCAAMTRPEAMRAKAGQDNANWRGGLPNCVDCGKRLSAWHVERCKKCARAGIFNPNWRNGVTPIHKLIRHSAEYREWRLAVFERGNYTCVQCGQRNGDKHADHIKPFALYPESRLDIDNGRTLCVPCHRATDTYGGSFLRKLINAKVAA